GTCTPVRSTPGEEARSTTNRAQLQDELGLHWGVHFSLTSAAQSAKLQEVATEARGMTHPGQIRGCPSFRRQAALSRRGVLGVGAACGLGLTLPGLLRAQTQPRPAGATSTYGRAKSLIVLYLHGGHAQQETWDPKPDGPSPERGEFGAINT